jgi:hypothetical protein
MYARVGNQRSRGVVIARLRLSIRNLLHQHRDLHQSTYLYLSEDLEPIPHQGDYSGTPMLMKRWFFRSLLA